jgi:splicing factor 3B subunit 4
MASLSAAVRQRNQEATLWVGGLDERVDDDLLWELFVQAGPLADVSVPVDKVNGRSREFGFVEFRSEADAEYALKVMNMVSLYGKPLRVRRAGEGGGGGGGGEGGGARADVGANLFVGGLAPEAVEKTLFDTFSAFGGIVEVRVQRDPDTGAHKGFGFVSFDAFEAADAAIEALNGQFLAGRPVVVQFAFRKDSKTERHGSAAERAMAAALRASRAAPQLQPHKFFAPAAGQVDASVPHVAGAVVGGAGGGARMLGLPPPALPPMLPPMAILSASLVPPLPPPPPGAPPLVPPPLPPHLAALAAGVNLGVRADNRPAWMVSGAAP